CMYSRCCYRYCTSLFLSFFFQAEDGIRDSSVTGVQTCALPIYRNFPYAWRTDRAPRVWEVPIQVHAVCVLTRSGGDAVGVEIAEIGRASCRERVCVA